MTVPRPRRSPRLVAMLSTAASRDEAVRIAAALVDERLAACVNLVAPITSIYRWRGAVERADEVLLIVKTRRSLSARVAARIRALHSYDVAEAIVLPIEGGAADYLAWVAGETAPLAAAAKRPAAPSMKPRPRRR